MKREKKIEKESKNNRKWNCFNYKKNRKIDNFVLIIYLLF